MPKTVKAARADKGQNVRVKKDKNAPKPSRSAYTFFLEESHARIKAEDPNASFGEVSKLISSQWREMDEDAKSVYVEMSERDKERFLMEKEAYVPTQGFDCDGKALMIGKNGKKRRTKKDKNLPKGALSSYIIFCTQMRDIIKTETPDIANTDIMRQTGERWREMSTEQKAPWEALARQDKQRYEEEMAVYRNDNL